MWKKHFCENREGEDYTLTLPSAPRAVRTTKMLVKITVFGLSLYFWRGSL